MLLVDGPRRHPAVASSQPSGTPLPWLMVAVHRTVVVDGGWQLVASGINFKSGVANFWIASPH
ncbi:hypothetical protein ACNKHN_08355 [Shigella flexneri]